MTVRRVVVVGSGIAPAMAAIAIRRAFARGGVEVEWIETPDAGSPHRTVAGLPNLQVFHRLLGLSEAELLRACAGTFALGRHYVGFSPG
ncbi:MAG: tryptophan 7-halogenase, partial [Sphingomonas sp.]